MAESLSPALRAVSDAVLAVASQQSVEDVLQQLVHRARELAGARYAALGTPDGEGGFTRFLVSGMSDELIAKLGPLPRQHGMLGAMLETAEPFIYPDIHDHPRFRGWWPSAHPDMRSFLGVPIVAPEGVIGAFYLTDKEGADGFGASDRELIELLAAHAAIAITNAGLYERSRELSILAERNRLALELHDAVSQKLFSLVLTAEAAGDAARAATRRGRPRARRAAAGARARGARRAALADPRAAPARARARRPLRRAAQARRRRCARLHRRRDRARHRRRGAAATAARDREVLRVAQEALQNAVRHAGARRRSACACDRADGGVVLEVADDGVGLRPRRSRAALAAASG